jgi:hypothetical protein
MPSIVAYDKDGNIQMALSWSGKPETEKAQRDLVPKNLTVLDIDQDHPAVRDCGGWRVKGGRLVKQ